MAKRNMIVALHYSPTIESQSSTAPTSRFDAAIDLGIPGLVVDAAYAPVPLHALKPRTSSTDPNDLSAALELNLAPESTTYIVRAAIEEGDVDRVRAQPGVAGVFSDPYINPCVICPGSPPLGDHNDVEALLCTSKMHKCGMDGAGVLVAIVDTGVNLAYLNSKGKTPSFNAGWSWTLQPGTPGSMPVDHGTMCAFDVCIAAPKCTILDIALLRPAPSLAALLSDAVKAYAHLLNIMLLPRRIGEFRSMVVNNSWGMFHPSWDFPPGDPANYSDNPNHPFNIAVASLEVAGADILFAAGNCGADCPDMRCQGQTTNAIYGANGHPQVLCVAGVDTTKQRVGYSTIGPGRLTNKKPDISGYTHFAGSGVYAADGGTSAATPVVAGVVAATRSKRPYNPMDSTTFPAAIRSLVTSTAQDLGASGYDYKHGHGVVDGCELAKKFCKVWWLDICKVHRWICKGVFRWPELPGPRPLIRWFDIPEIPFKVPRVIRFGRAGAPGQDEDALIEKMIDELVQRSGVADPVQLGYILGVMHAQQMRLISRTGFGGTFSTETDDPPSGADRGGDCGCGSKD
ncbi:MAG: S8 family serine peptidase [Nitrospira sp.]|nr:S8 family serine peptidase [Nitrospira sp.]